MKTNLGVLVLALGIACVQPLAAQTFKRVNVNLNAPLVQVSSGGSSVWALASNGNPYIFNGAKFVLANTISLSQIAVGGGSTAQADSVWALNSSGSIFHASKSGASWVFSQVPGVLDGIQVGLGYQQPCYPYEVWGLNSSSQIYRYNFCTKQFDQEPGFLCDIHVGGGDIWGADCGPDVFRFNFSTGSFDQITGDPFFAFPALTVGPNGETWGIDTSTSHIWQYDPFCTWHDFGFGFDQVQAGGNGTWALSGNNIYRLEPSKLSFVPVPGALTSISVGTGGGVWGINSSNQVFRFTTP